MPLASVDNDDTVLFYEDSGIPDAHETYTTLVLIHGITYTGGALLSPEYIVGYTVLMTSLGIFAKLLPFAAQYRLRLIRVNQRDYPPSSLFTISELSEFSSPNKDTQVQSLRKRGVEMANLLVSLIDTLKLPPISSNNGAGGISVLGWSMGVHLPIALLSSASALSQEVQQQLELYLRSIVLFGAILCFSICLKNYLLMFQTLRCSQWAYPYHPLYSPRIVPRAYIGPTSITPSHSKSV